VRHKLFAIALLLFTVSADALVLEALYEADVPVSSQGASDRARGIKKGLEQVLIKVSGNSHVATVGTVQNNFHKFESLVQQYSYFRQKASKDNGSQLMLKVRFETTGVDRLLKQAGQAVWGTNRPLVLVWIAKQDLDSQELVGSDSDPDVFNMIQQAAAHRGLPVMMPVMDIHDMQTISFADVWNPRPISVREASKRYNVDAILVGRVKHQHGEGWTGHWELLMGNNDQLTWDYAKDSQASVLSEIIDDATDALASRFAILESVHKEAQVVLNIENVDTFQEYEKVMSYLRGLSPVSSIEVVSMQPSEVKFKLDVVGGQQSLVQAMGLNQLLRPIKRSSFTFLGESALDYVYTR